MESYEDLLENAFDEIKRADHLIYVSLKYTRTVDVIRSIVIRLINTFDFVIDALLLIKGDEENSKKTVSPKIKTEALIKQYKDEEHILKLVKFYLLLRKIILYPDYTSRNEFRRRVTMGCVFDGEPFDVDIDLITEYFKKTIKMVTESKKLMGLGIVEND